MVNKAQITIIFEFNIHTYVVYCSTKYWKEVMYVSIPQMPSFTRDDGMLVDWKPMLLQSKVPFGHAEVPVTKQLQPYILYINYLYKSHISLKFTGFKHIYIKLFVLNSNLVHRCHQDSHSSYHWCSQSWLWLSHQNRQTYLRMDTAMLLSTTKYLYTNLMS